MPEYIIHGVHRETGEKLNPIPICADDQKAAIRIATRKYPQLAVSKCRANSTPRYAYEVDVATGEARTSKQRSRATSRRHGIIPMNGHLILAGFGMVFGFILAAGGVSTVIAPDSVTHAIAGGAFAIVGVLMFGFGAVLHMLRMIYTDLQWYTISDLERDDDQDDS